jgi:hypothetical protein
MEDTTVVVSRAIPTYITEHTLSNQAVQVLVVGTLKTKVSSADIINGLIVHHEGAVGVFEGGVSGQDGIIWLHNGRSRLRCRVHAELQLDLLAVVDRETFHEQSTETRSSAASEGVEDEEALQPGAVVCNTANFVQDLINQLLADGVVATSVVVRGILLASDHQFRVKEGAIGAGADLVNNIGLEITVDGAGDIFALAYSTMRTCLEEIERNCILTGLGEEGAEALIRFSGLAFLGQVSIGLGEEHVSSGSLMYTTMCISHSHLYVWGSWIYIPGYRAQGSRAARKSKSVISNLESMATAVFLVKYIQSHLPA